MKLALPMLALLAVPRVAWALDTVETYEPGGLTRFEAATGLAGLGRPERERHVTLAALLGIGLTDRFSVRYAWSGQYAEHLDDGQSAQGIGMLLTALDTYNLDLDLTLDFAALSRGRLLVGPGFEVNVDAHPDRSSFGLFVQGGPAVGGRIPSPEVLYGPRARVTIPAALGAYYALAEAHRLLLAVDFIVLPESRGDEHDRETTSLRLGYVGALTDAIAVLPEVFLDFGPARAPARAGGWVGMRADVR